jgi:signal transduction histidine kinase
LTCGWARCQVVIEADAREVRIEVTNDGSANRRVPEHPGHPGGHGIVGMRERVAMYDGTFTAGPLPEGGFRVSARLPYQPSPNQSASLRANH